MVNCKYHHSVPHLANICIWYSAKYPIVAAQTLIQAFRHSILFVYNIGCTFSTTLSKSSVGQLAHNFNFKSCTGSFHGATHNHLFQLHYNIGYKEGAGIEDGEGNEHLFSASNALATVTCHSSAFNWCQCIHIHFKKWHWNKYEHLGVYLHCTFSTWLTSPQLTLWQTNIQEWWSSSRNLWMFWRWHDLYIQTSVWQGLPHVVEARIQLHFITPIWTKGRASKDWISWGHWKAQMCRVSIDFSFFMNHLLLTTEHTWTGLQCSHSWLWCKHCHLRQQSIPWSKPILKWTMPMQLCMAGRNTWFNVMDTGFSWAKGGYHLTK